MKIVSVFESMDGAIFKNKEDCINHENLIIHIDQIMSQLNPKPNTISTPTQQNKETVQLCFKKLSDILDLWVDEEEKTFNDCFFNMRDSILGRRFHDLYSKDKHKYIRNCWYRFDCIDRNFKEWLYSKHAI